MRSVRSGRLAQVEAAASEATVDKDLAIGAALACIKQERLYVQGGFASFWEYLDHNKGLFGVGRRQAERLISGQAVFYLLRHHPHRPTRERQVR